MAVEIVQDGNRDRGLPTRVNNPIRPWHRIASPPHQFLQVLKAKPPLSARKGADRRDVSFKLKPERGVAVELTKDRFPVPSQLLPRLLNGAARGTAGVQD
eukprot:8697993-Pyramimonas_sp.AAC.1